MVHYGIWKSRTDDRTMKRQALFCCFAVRATIVLTTFTTGRRISFRSCWSLGPVCGRKNSMWSVLNYTYGGLAQACVRGEVHFKKKWCYYVPRSVLTEFWFLIIRRPKLIYRLKIQNRVLTYSREMGKTMPHHNGKLWAPHTRDCQSVDKTRATWVRMIYAG